MKQVRFSQFLFEAPLPDDWDNALYNERVPFARRVKYAQERARKMGAGSSRVAFVIPYQGRDTILKVAKNEKGMAQNEVEARNLEDWYLGNLGIVIPLIDYDESNNRPTWIHTEMAQKAKPPDFVKASGVPLDVLISYAENQSGRKRNPHYDFSKVDEESDLVQALVDLVGNYSQLPTGDLRQIANWGIYNGKPVIIDMGLDDDVMSMHYSRSR